MLARTLTILGSLAIAASVARADDLPGTPVGLPRLPPERVPVLVCNVLPVELGKMVRVSRGTALLDVLAEVWAVSPGVTDARLVNTWQVADEDLGNARRIEHIYHATGFTLHELWDFPDIESEPTTLITIDATTDEGSLTGPMTCTTVGR